jgi:hypothetical protein
MDVQPNKSWFLVAASHLYAALFRVFRIHSLTRELRLGSQ